VEALLLTPFARNDDRESRAEPSPVAVLTACLVQGRGRWGTSAATSAARPPPCTARRTPRSSAPPATPRCTPPTSSRRATAARASAPTGTSPRPAPACPRPTRRRRRPRRRSSRGGRSGWGSRRRRRDGGRAVAGGGGGRRRRPRPGRRPPPAGGLRARAGEARRGGRVVSGERRTSGRVSPYAPKPCRRLLQALCEEALRNKNRRCLFKHIITHRHLSL
jgi:hypothetical protein